MSQNITVESKTKTLKKELAEHINKTNAHWKSGKDLPNGIRRDKWHKKWEAMKKKERGLDNELEKSLLFLAKKQKQTKKNKRQKKTKSFSEHLMSKM